MTSITDNQIHRQGMALWRMETSSGLDMLSVILGHSGESAQEVAQNKNQELPGDTGDEDRNMSEHTDI